jgi:hypothetical protein
MLKLKIQRSAQVKPGKYKEALGTAVRVSEHLRAKYGLTGQVYTVRFGAPVGRIITETEFDSFAAYEAIQQKLLSDREYYGLLAVGGDAFVEGSVSDLVMLPVDARDPLLQG